jgi:hypothetical protein
MRLLLLAALLPLLDLSASPVIEASGELSATIRDANGDTVGGIGSGIIYDAKTDEFLCLSDRGPGDGTLPYRPRIAVIKISQEGETLLPELVKTIIFKDEQGRDMTGLLPDNPDSDLPMMKDGRTCIDPEALALSKDGRLFVTDEYGPFLYEFKRDGTMLRRIALPAEFQPREASGKLNYTDKANLVSGRAINQGPEGMCLLPDETRAALIFQSASVQDGGKPSGLTKILVIDLASGTPVAMYRYPFSLDEAGLPPTQLSVNDLVALDDRRFLVLERDGQGRDGAKDHQLAKYKTVWVADTNGATNLLGKNEDKKEVPVAKQLLFNLASLAKDQKNLAAKWEGIVVIPPFSKEEVTLLMTADNDFLAATIHEEGKSYAFPRAEDEVPTQFFKIRAPLPKNP